MRARGSESKVNRFVRTVWKMWAVLSCIPDFYTKLPSKATCVFFFGRLNYWASPIEHAPYVQGMPYRTCLTFELGEAGDPTYHEDRGTE